MIDFDVLSIGLRALLYTGTIAAAGGVLFGLSFPLAANSIRSDLQRQILFGCGLVLLIEPLRYIVFQLNIAGGDASLAFSPSLRAMGLESSAGRAALVRLAAAAVLAARGRRVGPLAVLSTLAIILSFILEGHTAADRSRALLAPALFIHVAAAHWWIGALYPLMLLTRAKYANELPDTVARFGFLAIWSVFGLIAAGLLLLVVLTGAQPDFESAYQQRFGLKLAGVAVVLSIACCNKFLLTPLLRTEPALGPSRLRTSLKLEMAIALAILAATAFAIHSAPIAE